MLSMNLSALAKRLRVNTAGDTPIDPDAAGVVADLLDVFAGQAEILEDLQEVRDIPDETIRIARLLHRGGVRTGRTVQGRAA